MGCFGEKDTGNRGRNEALEKRRPYSSKLVPQVNGRVPPRTWVSQIPIQCP